MPIEYSPSQDQLVRGLTHRMNNILTLFHGYLGVLMESDKLDAREREGLARISSGARAASELMDRTHALVRPASSTARELDLAMLLRLLEPSFEARRGARTELVVDVPEHLPIVCADAARLKTAIVELVRNALEATQRGGRVVVSCEAQPSPDGTKNPPWIAIRVTDNGPGIPERIASELFQPFVTTKTHQDSAGLGLPLALTFAQQHGGDIHHERRDGETRFELRLPTRR
jgi:signal transduction histidine kinase